MASGRAMSDIAAGKGRAPKPFMLDTRKLARADAVWNSKANSDAAVEPSEPSAKPARRKRQPYQAAAAAARKVPQFIEPELCKLVERPPDGEHWAHEVKIDGYRMQLRVADGEATLRTRKGLDWTDKFQPIAAAAANFPDCIIDGEVAALDASGAPDFAALQAALSEGDDSTTRAISLSTCCTRPARDLRELPLQRTQAAAQETAESRRVARSA